MSARALAISGALSRHAPDECLADRWWTRDLCEDAHPVPTCASEIAVERYESCGTESLDALRAIPLDCARVGDPDILAMLASTLPSETCEVLNEGSCNFFGPR